MRVCLALNAVMATHTMLLSTGRILNYNSEDPYNLLFLT